MGDLTLNILGFAAVNDQLKVELRDPVTKTLVRSTTPFLDGTARIPKIDAGSYELSVIHNNLALPVLTRPVRVLPGDTRISVLIDPSKFRNTPIEDIPDANLTPVRELAESVAETTLPLAQKLPGEAIRSQDWNTMASSIRDLALAMAELTRLVSPVGHDHPEFVRKFDEIGGNFNTLVTTLNASMAELQRQIQAEQVRRQIEGVLTAAEIAHDSARGKEILALADDLDNTATDTPRTFAQKTRNIAVQLNSKIETLVAEKPDLLENDSVKKLSDAADVLKQTRASTYDAELEMHRAFNRKVGGGIKDMRIG